MFSPCEQMHLMIPLFNETIDDYAFHTHTFCLQVYALAEPRSIFTGLKSSKPPFGCFYKLGLHPLYINHGFSPWNMMKSSMILLPSLEETRGPQVKFPHATNRVVLGWILAVCPGPPRHIATTTWAQRKQRKVRVVKTPPDLIKLRIEEKLSSAEELMQPSKSCNYHNDNTQTQRISKYNDTIITHHHTSSP